MPKGDKYINLTNYLKNINEENVKMSFKDIENLLGEKLCDSAYKYSKFGLVLNHIQYILVGLMRDIRKNLLILIKKSLFLKKILMIKMLIVTLV